MARRCVAATPPRDRVPALPAPRAAVPREDTTGHITAEAHGSKDATRLSSVREIKDFSRAVIVTTVRHFGIDRMTACGRTGKPVTVIITTRRRLTGGSSPPGEPSGAGADEERAAAEEERAEKEHRY